MSEVAAVPPGTLWLQRRELREDRAARAESKRKRVELLTAIEHDPDADEGLRRQARLYRERLEAGMEQRGDG